VPTDWDCRLPSDLALNLPGADRPTILLSDQAEVKQTGYDRQNDHPLVFCSDVKGARVPEQKKRRAWTNSRWRQHAIL
jgi:hypothetical protein